jgi:hypothetical protein
VLAAVLDHLEAWDRVVERLAGGRPSFTLVEAPGAGLPGGYERPGLRGAPRLRRVEGGAVQVAGQSAPQKSRRTKRLDTWASAGSSTGWSARAAGRALATRPLRAAPAP